MREIPSNVLGFLRTDLEMEFNQELKRFEEQKNVDQILRKCVHWPPRQTTKISWYSTSLQVRKFCELLRICAGRDGHRVLKNDSSPSPESRVPHLLLDSRPSPESKISKGLESRSKFESESESESESTKKC